MSPEIFLTLGGALKWLGLALSPLLLLPLIVTIWPDPVERIAKWMSTRIDAVSGWALGGATAGAIILVGAQLMVVLLRYAFGLSFTWLNEIVIYAFAAMFMLGSASALRDDAHVRVDILRPHFGARRRNWIELAGIYLFLFPICIRLLAMTEQGLARSWALLEGSRESDGLPLLFLFKTLLPAFAVLMLVQGLSEALKAALRLTGKLEDVAEEEPHGGVHGT
jgi:TRAP-type mannitol/chloroaromatic compound transport system permease small subunit